MTASPATQASSAVSAEALRHEIELLESTAWPTLRTRSRAQHAAAPTLTPPVAQDAPPAAQVPAAPADDRVLALHSDRALAERQLAGYTTAVARRFGLRHEEIVPPASGDYEVELRAEIARIDGELARRASAR